MGLVGVAHLVSHLRHIDFALAQQTGCLFHTEVAKETPCGDARDFLHLAMQLGTTETDISGKYIDIIFRVGHVGIDRAHDTIHEGIVIAFHLDILHALLLLNSTAELASQTAHIVDEVVNLDVQLVHVERLGDVGIGSALQSLELIFHSSFRGEHDDRQLRDVGVLLDAPQQGDAVHLGHHHIADDEVVGTGEQHLQCLLAVGCVVELVSVAQFANDVVGDFLVIIGNEDAELAIGVLSATCRQDLTGWVVSDNLLRLQVIVALRNGDDEASTLFTIGAILCLDLTSVHLDNVLAQVQTDACALHTEAVGIATLIEAVEEALLVFVLDAHPVVNQLNLYVVFLLLQHHLHLSPIVGVLEGVAQEIADDLVEVDAVYPCQHMIFVVLEGEGDVALIGIVLVEFTDARDEVHEIRLAAVQLHLVLVYPALIKYLVDEQHKPLGITVDGVDRRLKN